MEISFAKRYRIYEKSTIATDYNNLLGDKPKSANDANRENKLIQKQQIQPKSISPRAFARPSTTALVYKQTNNLIKPTIKTSDKKPNRTNTAIDYNRNTNLYYASPVNSDFFENIRLNEIKIYSKQTSQRNDTVYTSAPSPISKVPNNIKLKQQILNQYYKANETNISPNTGLSLKSNATTTTATSKLASYLQKSKLSNEEINKYLSYKKVDNNFLDPVLNLTKKISTNDNNKNKTNFTNNLSSSFSSFYNSNYLEKTTRMQSRLLNFNTSTNNKQNVLNRSRNNIGTSSFNNNNLKKKFNQLTTSRPVSDFRLKSGTKTPNTPPQQTQKPNQMKSNSFNKYFDEKYLKQRTAIQQQQQLAKLKTDTNNDASKKAGKFRFFFIILC